MSGIENLIGTDYDDTLIGDAGPNTLEGGAGDDALIGGAGDDTFVFYGINDGDDMILDFILTEDTVDMDALFDALVADQGGYATEGRARSRASVRGGGHRQ